MTRLITNLDTAHVFSDEELTRRVAVFEGGSKYLAVSRIADSNKKLFYPVVAITNDGYNWMEVATDEHIDRFDVGTEGPKKDFSVLFPEEERFRECSFSGNDFLTVEGWSDLTRCLHWRGSSQMYLSWLPRQGELHVLVQFEDGRYLAVVRDMVKSHDHEGHIFVYSGQYLKRLAWIGRATSYHSYRGIAIPRLLNYSGHQVGALEWVWGYKERPSGAQHYTAHRENERLVWEKPVRVTLLPKEDYRIDQETETTLSLTAR